MSYLPIVLFSVLFFFIIGTITLYFWQKNKENTYLQLSWVLSFALGFILFSSAWGISLFDYKTVPCETLVNSTTVSGNVTEYTYINSCADRVINPFIEGFYVVFLWFTYLLFMGGLAYAVIRVIKMIGGKL